MGRLAKNFDFPNSINNYLSIYVKVFMNRLAKHFDLPNNTGISIQQFM